MRGVTVKRAKRGVKPLPKSVSPLERVIVNRANRAQDRLIPRGEALHRLATGELRIDLASWTYAVIDDGVCPDWLEPYNRAG